MNYGDHNFIEITQKTVASRAFHSRRVEPVELDVSSASSQSSSSCRASRAVLFYKLDSQNALARHVERVESCRVET